jgi:ribosomal protein S27AE
MNAADLAAGWQTLAAAALSGMAEWRVQHPTATLREIEAAADEQLADLRARLLQDTALVSATADLAGQPVEQRPACPECGTPVEARGTEVRRLTTRQERLVTLRRSRAVCPACGAGHFPPG